MIIIFWRYKLARKTVGYVDDWCLVCHKVRSCAIRKLVSKTRLFGVLPIGWTNLGHDRWCRHCGFRCEGFVDEYPEIVRERPIDEPEQPKHGKEGAVIASDDPGWNISGDARRDPAQRAEIIERSFEAASLFAGLEKRLKYHSRGAQRAADVGFGILGASFVFMVLAVVLNPHLNNMNSNAPLPLWVDIGLIVVTLLLPVSVVCLVLWAFLGMTAKQRFVRHQLHPMMARMLADLNPVLEEIQKVVSEYRSKKLLLGKLVKPGPLMVAIAKRRRKLMLDV